MNINTEIEKNFQQILNKMSELNQKYCEIEDKVRLIVKKSSKISKMHCEENSRENIAELKERFENIRNLLTK